jgi:hypothetical protein
MNQYLATILNLITIAIFIYLFAAMFVSLLSILIMYLMGWL